MLPADPRSGFCDVKGRRRSIEDHYAVVYDDAYTLWGVFDGHRGREAARFAADRLPAELGRRVDASDVKESAIVDAFLATDAAFSEAPSKFHAPGLSGTTATVALLGVGGILAVANVGDSRAVACCDKNRGPIPMSVDHVASDPAEAARIQHLGGTVEYASGVARVGGDVVVTRSVGNANFGTLLSAEPHVVVHDLAARPLDFLVLATDGLWDVVDSAEAVRFVAARLAGDAARDAGAYQAAATALTHEALVRQTTDNVGVCVIDLRNRAPPARRADAPG